MGLVLAMADELWALSAMDEDKGPGGWLGRTEFTASQKAALSSWQVLTLPARLEEVRAQGLEAERLARARAPPRSRAGQCEASEGVFLWFSGRGSPAWGHK